MILGGSQANLLISALKRKQGTDLLSAPRITVVDGEEATITIAQEFIYPIQYEAPGTASGKQQRWSRWRKCRWWCYHSFSNP